MTTHFMTFISVAAFCTKHRYFISLSKKHNGLVIASTKHNFKARIKDLK